MFYAWATAGFDKGGCNTHVIAGRFLKFGMARNVSNVNQEGKFATLSRVYSGVGSNWKVWEGVKKPRSPKGLDLSRGFRGRVSSLIFMLLEMQF